MTDRIKNSEFEAETVWGSVKKNVDSAACGSFMGAITIAKDIKLIAEDVVDAASLAADIVKYAGPLLVKGAYDEFGDNLAGVAKALKKRVDKLLP